MKKILMSGCSFTQSRINEPKEWKSSNRAWIPYSDMMVVQYPELNITNKGLDSASNGMIHNSIINELIQNDFNYDFVIVQWSAVMRAHIKTVDGMLDSIPTGTFNPVTFMHEYVSKNNMDLGTVTSVFNIIDKQYYLYTLILIYSLQSILEKNNIPYFMFWGWEQITPEVENHYDKILKLIYNENFWVFEKNGGMNEYCVDILGKRDALVIDDLHPTTKSHELFLNDILAPILNKL